MGSDFKIEYKQGRDNRVADALSRKLEDQEAVLAFISFPSADWIDELKSIYGSSEEIQEIINKLLQGQEGPKGYSLHQGLLLRKGKMVMVPATSFHDKILHFS